MHRKNSYEFVKSFVKRILYRPKFSTNDIKIGCETRFGRNVRFNCKRVRIGNGVIFHDNIRVDAEEFDVGDGVIFQDDIRIETTVFRIGDYGTIYFGCFFPGPGKLEIGHNFWLGNNSIIDSQGGTVIGNNVGIGADSQLWTHMKYGDIVAGCRFDSVAPLTIGNDVWLVGHNLVSPVSIGDRSLVMLGSLVVKNIPQNRVFAGVPAQDQTDKFGTQFSDTDAEYRKEKLRTMVEKFAVEHNIKNIWDYIEICDKLPQTWGGKKTIIDVCSRSYYKTRSSLELMLMRYILPAAKYTPSNISLRDNADDQKDIV